MADVIIHESSIGYFQRRSFSFEIPSSAPGATVDVSQTLDFSRLIWRAILHSSPEQRGDWINICMNPNTLIGALALAANATDTVITVDASAAANAWVGQYLQFNDVSMEKVQIKTIVGVSITLSTPLVNAHAALTPLGLCVNLVDKMYLDGKEDVILAGKGVRGQLADTDSEAVIEYTNATGRSKTFIITLEYYTGS